MGTGDEIKPRSPLPAVPTIDVETLSRWLADCRPLTILDVRPSRERAEWSIPDSIHVDAYDALWARDPGALTAVTLPLDRPVVTVCAAGRTSVLAAALLSSRGHEVYSLARGMNAWSMAWNRAELAAGGIRILQVRRVGKGCLSYLVASGAEALVIDPSLGDAVYRAAAAEWGARIIGVLETHVHADHLSRARTLALSAAAALHLPVQRRTAFPHRAVRDGDSIPFGGSRITALRTPGHTGESTCYLLAEGVLFTGDTLFARGVGRPDLEGGGEEAAARARDLYGSLRRLLTLPDATLILAGHTGEAIPFDDRPVCSSVGKARTENHLLSLEENAFVQAVVTSIPETPPRFAEIIRLNEAGIMPPGDPAVLEAGANRCAVA